MAVIWSWRYGTLQADEVDDDDWQSSFFWMNEGDDCSVDGVEVNGTYLDRDAAFNDPEVKRRDEEAWAAARASAARVNEYRTIMVRHPIKPEYWGAVDTVKVDDVSVRMAELVELYGADRVKLSR